MVPNNNPMRSDIELLNDCVAPLWSSTATMSNGLPPPESLLAAIWFCCLDKPVGCATLLKEVLLETTVAVARTAVVDVEVGFDPPMPSCKEVAVVVDEVSDEIVSELAEEIVFDEAAEEVVFSASEVDFDRTEAVVDASVLLEATVEATVEATAVLQSA